MLAWIHQAEEAIYEWCPGVTPAAFDRLSPARVERMLTAARRRYERQMNLLAWTCANLMNATGNFSQDPVKVETLLESLLGAAWVDQRDPGRHERARRTFDRAPRMGQ